MSTNPYAAPEAPLEGGGSLPLDAAEADRRAHLRVERGLKTMGFLYIWGGGLVALSALSFGTLALSAGWTHDGPPRGEDLAVVLAVCGLLMLKGPLAVWAGLGLRRRWPQVRVAASLLAGLALLSVPVGTALGGYTLYLLWCAEGRRVFQPDYTDVIAATPQVRLGTSPVVKGIALVLVLGVVALVLVLVLGV